MSKLKIPFGLKNGQLLAASNVPNGLACGCSCPGCGARLVAKHPQEKVAHFAHHSDEACSSGYESALHLAAKQALLQHREIFVPSIAAEKRLYDEGTGLRTIVTKILPAMRVTLDSVEEESRDFQGIVPDIVACHKGKLLFIEIAVTHYVEKPKLEKLRQLGIPTLEIDLSDSPELPTLDEIKKMVISDATNRMWLINPRQQQLQQQVDAEAQKNLEDHVVRKLGTKLLLETEHGNYMRLSDREKLEIEVAASGFSYVELSPYIGKRVRGGRTFGVKPDVWQAAIFRRFICNGDSWFFEVEEVSSWLSKHLALTPPFPNAEKVAVWDYLIQLEAVGILKREVGQSFSVVQDDPGTEPGDLPF